MGVGGGCARIRREGLRGIVVVDIEEEELNAGTLPSIRLYICLTLHINKV